ncbi:MAG: hypothetical protein ACJAT4_000904 [Granulosicoccus sp.]|jgi:hypothetical protein
MKITTLLLICLLPYLFFAQNSDTLIFQKDSLYQMVITDYNGTELKKVSRYYTKNKLALKMSRADAFSRAIPYSKEDGFYEKFDSVLTFHLNGNLEHKKSYNPTIDFWYHYNEEEKISYVRKVIENDFSVLLWEKNGLEIGNLPIKLEGKIGESPVLFFQLKNNSDKDLSLKLQSLNPRFHLFHEEFNLPPNESYKIKVAVEFMQKIKNSTVFIYNEKGDIFGLPFELYGYDLSSENFDLGEKIEFEKPEKLIIKLDSKEKLLKIYRNEDMISNHSIPKIYNEVDIRSLEKGEYIFEIINLGNNQKRSCKVILK